MRIYVNIWACCASACTKLPFYKTSVVACFANNECFLTNINCMSSLLWTMWNCVSWNHHSRCHHLQMHDNTSCPFLHVGASPMTFLDVWHLLLLLHEPVDMPISYSSCWLIRTDDCTIMSFSVEGAQRTSANTLMAKISCTWRISTAVHRKHILCCTYFRYVLGQAHYKFLCHKTRFIRVQWDDVVRTDSIREYWGMDKL